MIFEVPAKPNYSVIPEASTASQLEYEAQISFNLSLWGIGFASLLKEKLLILSSPC